jgi:purine-binding chemotaxis protein CheW
MRAIRNSNGFEQGSSSVVYGETTMSQTVRAASPGQYVTLGVDREIFAVEVEKVREILDMRPIARIPNAPAFLLGMIDVRGRGVPVIDLRIKLGLTETDPTEQTRIVVLEVQLGERALYMGLLADRVFEVTSLDEQGWEQPPELGIRWRSDYIRAIGRRNAAFVIVFDLEHLLSSDEAALLTVTA